jgi:hypothetical protein
LLDLSDEFTSVGHDDNLDLFELRVHFHQTGHDKSACLSGAIDGLKRKVSGRFVDYVP